MLLRKQKSAGANLSLFPSWFPFYGFVVPFRCLVRFANVVTSGMVPPSRGWKRGCRDLKWFPLPCRAYVSRKREILQSRPILSPCNYSHNLSPSRSSDFSVNPFWNLLTNFTPPPPPGLFTCKFSDIDRQNIPVKFKFKLEIDITKHGDYSLGRHASNKRNTKTRRHQFQHSTKYPATGHRGCSVMEHRVFRLRSVNRVAEQERGARLDTTRPRDRERERERRGCFNEIAVMPCKWLGNSFRGFLYPPPDCTPRRLNSIPYIF